ncbi:MAG: hypothetical protein KGJ86_10930 [Chloroflexota bacterium]|nr:hypothetical protein [Chloroflexota bacterium]
MATRNRTLRLPEAVDRDLEAVARADGVSINEEVRRAIEAHIAARRKDEAFRARLAKMLEEDREILERLA